MFLPWLLSLHPHREITNMNHVHPLCSPFTRKHVRNSLVSTRYSEKGSYERWVPAIIVRFSLPPVQSSRNIPIHEPCSKRDTVSIMETFAFPFPDTLQHARKHKVVLSDPSLSSYRSRPLSRKGEAVFGKGNAAFGYLQCFPASNEVKWMLNIRRIQAPFNRYFLPQALINSPKYQRRLQCYFLRVGRKPLSRLRVV